MKRDGKALFFGDKNVMPIAGYYGPLDRFDDSDPIFHNRVDEHHFQALAEAGINLIAYCDVDYKKQPDLVMKSLDLCEKYGIRYMVFDSNIVDCAEQPDHPDYTTEKIEQYLSKYANHPAFGGPFLVDEPKSSDWVGGTKLIENYKSMIDVLQNQLGYVPYQSPINVWSIDREGYRESYEKYLDEYFETIQPQFVTWAYYPYSANKEDGFYGYFYNMNLMREHAKKAGIPYWSSIQAGGQWNDDKKHFDSELPYYPNEAQFDWNVNTVLAFGAQGISFFPLVQPEHFAWAGTEEEPEWDFKRNGLLGGTGEKNQWWHYAKRITKHIRAIDEVLMNCAHEGIIVTSDTAKIETREVTCRIETGTFRELQSVLGDAMVGCFDYNGKTALYVVNYSREHSQQITLAFGEVHNLRVIRNAEESHVNTKVFEVEMAAGEGLLLVIE